MTIKIKRCQSDKEAEEFLNKEVPKMIDYKYAYYDRGVHIFVCHYKEVNNEGQSSEKKTSIKRDKGRGKQEATV